MRPFSLLLAVAAALAPIAAPAQSQDAAALIASQTEAMRALAMLDGVWRGPATVTVTEADGRRVGFVQTERIGPLLGGSIKVIEGRGYADDGAVRFNAFAIVSFDPAARAYTMHSHALGHVGGVAPAPSWILFYGLQDDVIYLAW